MKDIGMPRSGANLEKVCSNSYYTVAKFKDFKDHFQNSRVFQNFH